MAYASEERGPSWYDVSAYCEFLRTEYGVTTHFNFTPPIRRFDGKGYTCWTVSACLSDHVGDKVRTVGKTEGWGSGGTHKTAPGALYRALQRAEEVVKERKTAAERQAAF